MVNSFSLIKDSLIKDYLIDQEDGIRQLIAWFLNLVMEEEALIQYGAKRYKMTDSFKQKEPVRDVLQGFLKSSCPQKWLKFYKDLLDFKF